MNRIKSAEIGGQLKGRKLSLHYTWFRTIRKTSYLAQEIEVCNSFSRGNIEEYPEDNYGPGCLSYGIGEAGRIEGKVPGPIRSRVPA